MAGEIWWIKEVRHEWAGHTWRALETTCPAKLLAEARLWADSPSGVLYVHAHSIQDAFGFTIAVSQRAAQTLRRHRPELFEPLAVGLLDELSVPEDPDPDYAEQAGSRHSAFPAVDTRNNVLYQYGRRLSEAPLVLLRLPETGDPDGVLDQVADHRRNWALSYAGRQRRATQPGHVRLRTEDRMAAGLRQAGRFAHRVSHRRCGRP